MALQPEQLRQKIPNWSLESDGELLEYMKSIAQNLEGKCKSTSSNLNNMMLGIDETSVRLGNATNNFLSIHQLKFVENRVVEEDETAIPEPVKEDTSENQPKLTYSEIFQLTVENSIKNMYKCHEKVTVELESDSDDDEETKKKSSVIRAIQNYSYINRPLPYIIGSKEWRDKWHAGLIESEDESESEEKEQFSESSDSEDLSLSLPSIAHTASESEGSSWGLIATKTLQTRTLAPSVSEDDANSISSAGSAIKQKHTAENHVKTDTDRVQGIPSQIRPPALFPDLPPEDILPKQKGLFDDSDDDQISNPDLFQSSNPNSSYFRGSQPERKNVNVFSNDPPHTIQIRNDAKPKKPVNLFLESDDEDDLNNNATKKVNLFDNEPPEDSPKPTTDPQKKTVNLFDDNDFDDFMNKLSDNKNNNKTNNVEKTSKKNANNLFDDVNDDDDDYMASITKSVNDEQQKNGKKGTTNKIKKITKLFDDDPPIDDFDDIFKPRTIIKDALFSGTKLFEEKKVEHKKVGPKQTVAPPIVEKSEVKLRPNLFEEEDNIFKTVPKKAAVETKKKVNLFDDIDDDDDIFNSMKKTGESSVKKINLFDDHDDDFLTSFKETPPSTEQPVNIPAPKEKIVDDHLYAANSDSIPAPVLLQNTLEEKIDLFSEVTGEDASIPPEDSSIIQGESNKVDNQEEQDDAFQIPVDDNEAEGIVAKEDIKEIADEHKHISNEIEYHLTTNDITKTKEIIPNLFDEPPEDPFDEIMRASLTTEAVKSPEVHIKPSSTNNTSALTFSPVGLFDDMPPSDDELDDRFNSKLGVDNDDNDDNIFNKSSNNNPNKSNTSFLFDDEPPPDDEDVMCRDEIDDYSADFNPKGNISDNSFKSISEIIEKRNKNESKFESKEKIVPKINKLNANFNINVAALLPGAKPPQSNRIVEVTATTVSEDSYVPTAAPKFVTSDASSNPRILSSLNKTRAKIQVKRRPSSRHARQTSYRQSLIEDVQSIEAVEDEADEEDQIGAKSVANIFKTSVGNSSYASLPSFSKENIQKPELPDHEKILPTPTIQHVRKTNYQPSLEDDIQPFELPQDENKKSAEIMRKPLFQSSPQHSRKISNQPQKDTVQSKELPSEKVAPRPSHVPITVLMQQNLSIKELNQRLNARLFDPLSDDDDIFNSKPVIEKKITNHVKPVKNESKLFGDSDTENDDLFASSSSKSFSQKDKVIAKDINKSIFGSDDDDGDDIFSKVTSMKPKKILQKNSKKTSLFGDDDDDDDDLFGGKSITKAITKISALPSSAPLVKVDKNTLKPSEPINDPLADLL